MVAFALTTVPIGSCSRDPIGYADGLNLYPTGRSVLRWVDPLGLSGDLIPPQETCAEFLAGLPELIDGEVLLGGYETAEIMCFVEIAASMSKTCLGIRMAVVIFV
jgi:hypothetical protein